MYQYNNVKGLLTQNETCLTWTISELSGQGIDWSSYLPYQVCIAIIDILWVLHRMVKAVGIGRLLLLGYPVYVDAREKKSRALVFAFVFKKFFYIVYC